MVDTGGESPNLKECVSELCAPFSGLSQRERRCPSDASAKVAPGSPGKSAASSNL